MKTTDNQQELFVVVDPDDNVLGYKTRQECHSDKKLIHRSTSVVIYNKKGEILLQKRSKTKDLFPGYFTTSASGHVGKGESYEDAARREMMEEIGVDVPLTFVSKMLLEMNNETEIDALFSASYDGPFKINKKEVNNVSFISPDKIRILQDKLTTTAIACFKQLGIL